MTRRSSAVILKGWELIGWMCKVRSRKSTGYRLLTRATVTQQIRATLWFCEYEQGINQILVCRRWPKVSTSFSSKRERSNKWVNAAQMGSYLAGPCLPVIGLLFPSPDALCMRRRILTLAASRSSLLSSPHTRRYPANGQTCRSDRVPEPVELRPTG